MESRAFTQSKPSSSERLTRVRHPSDQRRGSYTRLLSPATVSPTTVCFIYTEKFKPGCYPVAPRPGSKSPHRLLTLYAGIYGVPNVKYQGLEPNKTVLINGSDKGESLRKVLSNFGRLARVTGS